MVDCNEVSVLVDAQSLQTQSKKIENRKKRDAGYMSIKPGDTLNYH